MKAGDLVKADPWVFNGKTGVVIEVQQVEYCISAYVLLDIGLKLVRIENLKVISDSQ